MWWLAYGLAAYVFLTVMAACHAEGLGLPQTLAARRRLVRAWRALIAAVRERS